ncbi:MAG: hypothetical protein EAZ63_03620 [Runella slithyformis]|nr:MAG: hypothetical protein EAZ63_03620 [Runella slithyformis]
MNGNQQRELMADKVEGYVNDYVNGVITKNEAVVGITEFFCDKMVEISENWATDVKTMRNAQTAYFASKKANRYGDRKLLEYSKKLEGDLDKMVEITLSPTKKEVQNEA